MDVTILGCRGSTPSVGAAFQRYGGDTSAVAVAGDAERPGLVLDAGTGIRNLDASLGGEPFRGSILLTHLHWDHTHGLPFASALDREDAEIDLYLPAQDGDPLEVLSQAIGPPHFPITPDQLRGTWRFHSLEAGHHEISGFDVLASDVCHKGGRTFGYRVSDHRSTLGYIPDHWLAAADSEPSELVKGVDLLLHDAQHVAAEMDTKHHLGHSTAEYVLDLAERNAVARAVLFHHDPSRTDDEIDRIVDHLQSDGVSVSAAAAGATYRP